jgi:predicted regulator of Ras-like GTPase activity (Roadblock/LC7/MglB family)
MNGLTFRESLQKVVDTCEGAVAGVVMGLDGVTVESVTRDPTTDARAISREISVVLPEVRKAAELLEVGALEEITLRSEKLTFIIRILDADHFCGLALHPDGNFGKGRFLMRMTLAGSGSEH